jgi:hypothetical protein
LSAVHASVADRVDLGQATGEPPQARFGEPANTVVEAKLADDRDLADTIVFGATGPRAIALGRWTVERVLDLLLERESPPIANTVKMEALSWCETLGLPAPHVRLDEEDVTALQPVSSVPRASVTRPEPLRVAR